MLSGHLRLLNIRTGKLRSSLCNLFYVYLWLSIGKINKTQFSSSQDTCHLVRNAAIGRSWNSSQEAVGSGGQGLIRTTGPELSSDGSVGKVGGEGDHEKGMPTFQHRGPSRPSGWTSWGGRSREAQG